MKRLELIGQRFGRLVVTRDAGCVPPGRTTWECRCDCGATTVVRGISLRYGAVKSCGCAKLQLTPEGSWHRWPAPRKRLYNTWLAMRSRCGNPNHYGYPWYGGRGIRVSYEWDSYAQFERDMGPHPGIGWTLDRVDPNEHYNVGNCRWATRKTQARNRRDNVINVRKAQQIREMYAQGGRRHIDVANIFGVSKATVSRIVTGKSWS